MEEDEKESKSEHLKLLKALVLTEMLQNFVINDSEIAWYEIHFFKCIWNFFSDTISMSMKHIFWLLFIQII